MLAPSVQRPFQKLPLTATPEEVALRLRNLPGFVWLDQAGHPHDVHSGISILAALPRKILRGNLAKIGALRAALQEVSGRGEVGVDSGIPQSGLIGSIDFNGDYCFGSYETMLVFDHADDSWSGCGELADPAWMADFSDCGKSARFLGDAVVSGEFALEFAPKMRREDFCALVRRAQDYIAAGDIYQVNLAHPFSAPWPDGADPFPFYLKLRHFSPAPCAAFLDLGGRRVLSSSPESFLRMSANALRTRPIKGTRPRFRDLAADQKSALDLLTSEKERAELLMITDLERNDLGRVCEFGSVTVPELLKLETYAQVYHLVSTVEGRLLPGLDHLDVLQAAFPGGSISGAPKKRALEIIRELEPFPRGLYTGAIGILGANQESHLNIAIRTVVIENGHATFHVGAGIVADSDPGHEWEETLHKARGILLAAEAGALE